MNALGTHSLSYLGIPDEVVVSMNTNNLVWRLRGQSNAVGLGNVGSLTDTTLDDPYPAVRTSQYISTAPTDPIVWTDYGIASLAPYHTPVGFGIELSMGRALNAAFPGRVVITKVAVNSSGLEQHWKPTSGFPAAQTLFAQAAVYEDAAVAAIGGTVAADVWIQGEQDSISAVWSAAYKTNMLAYIDAQRARSSGTRPFLITRLIDDGAAAAYIAVVRAAEDEVATLRPWVTIIDVDDLNTTDTLHFDADSYDTLGDRVAAGYLAAAQTTTLSAVLADSADPVTTSASFSYTVVVSNGSAVAASNVAVVVTLDAALTYSSAVGSGWTITRVGQVVTCKRASAAAGAAPTITITVVAPSSFGAGSVTSSVAVVASNVETTATDAEVTTLQLPAITQDATSLDYYPATDAEWTAMIALAGLTGKPNPDIALLCQEASGDLFDAIGGFAFVANGTGQLYQQAHAGITRKVVGVTDGTAGGWLCTAAGLPAGDTDDIFVLAIADVTASPGATGRHLFGCFTNEAAAIRSTNTPRMTGRSGANTTNGASSHVAALRPYGLRHLRSASTVIAFNDLEKLSVTIGTTPGKRVQIGGSGVLPSANRYAAIYIWLAARATAWAADADVKTLAQSMGHPIAW